MNSGKPPTPPILRLCARLPANPQDRQARRRKANETQVSIRHVPPVGILRARTPSTTRSGLSATMGPAPALCGPGMWPRRRPESFARRASSPDAAEPATRMGLTLPSRATGIRLTPPPSRLPLSARRRHRAGYRCPRDAAAEPGYPYPRDAAEPGYRCRPDAAAPASPTRVTPLSRLPLSAWPRRAGRRACLMSPKRQIVGTASPGLHRREGGGDPDRGGCE
jgi:hypothetical protein